MTYTELVTLVSDYCENTFPTVDMNTFIKQAEQRVYNTVQLANLRKNVTGSLTASNKYLACPSDFMSAYSLAIYPAAGGEYLFLLNKDVNYLREAYPTANDTGLPLYYAIFGPSVSSNVTSNELTFIMGPTPNTSYTVELHYYYYPQSIVTAGTSWLGDNYDPVLLYGSLREAYLYMKGEQDLIANVEAKYNEALGQLKRLGDGMEKQDAYRSGQPRVRVT